jgi:NAD(P)-dependent dehydrogenase (short-subunit alcohol dehydrogenase family)
MEWSVQDFGGKVAVITGAASGIGLGMAQRFAEEGMKVVLGDIEEPALRAAEAQLAESGADVLGVPCNVTAAEEVQALADRAIDRYGAVHVFCNNAGVGAGGLSWEAPIETWRWVLDVNLWGPIHGVRTFVPLLLEHDDAHIVNTASVAGLVAAAGMGPYNVSKFGVVALAQTLYHEMRLMGGAVKVHVLCPGWVSTNIARSERNRGASYGTSRPEDAATADLLAGILERGMAPVEVADKVLAAMRADRFWILTHEDEGWSALVDGAQESLRDRTNPPLAVPPDITPSASG